MFSSIFQRFSRNYSSIERITTCMKGHRVVSSECKSPFLFCKVHLAKKLLNPVYISRCFIVTEGNKTPAKEDGTENTVTHKSEPVGSFDTDYADKSENSENHSNYTIFMRGLPYSLTNDDIVKFFAPENIKPSKVLFKYDRFGNTNGKAEVHFETANEAAKALSRHNAYIGHRYIELSDRPFIQMNADRILFRHAGAETGTRTGFGNYRSGQMVKLFGLPFTATREDVHKFFEPLKIVPTSIEFKYTSRGYPTGKCDVRFKTQEETLLAMKNNKLYMGGRYVEMHLPFPLNDMGHVKSEGQHET